MILARLIEQTISEVKVEEEVRVEVANKPLKRAQIGSYNLTYIILILYSTYESSTLLYTSHTTKQRN